MKNTNKGFATTKTKNTEKVLRVSLKFYNPSSGVENEALQSLSAKSTSKGSWFREGQAFVQ